MGNLTLDMRIVGLIDALKKEGLTLMHDKVIDLIFAESPSTGY